MRFSWRQGALNDFKNGRKAGVLKRIGNIIMGLSKGSKGNGLVTQYSIDLNGQLEEKGETLLYKDRRVTSRQSLEIIYEVCMVLMQSFDIHEICEKVMQTLFNYLNRIDSGAILIKDPQSGELKTLIARSRSSTQNIRINYSRTIVQQVIREGKAVILADMSRQENVKLSGSIEALGIKSIICVPLMSKAGVQGVFYLHSITAAKGFRKDDLYFLVCISTPTAMAIENAQLYTKRMEAEQALRESEEKYRNLVENANDAILIVQDRTIKFANPRTQELTGYDIKELQGMDPFDLCHPEEKETIIDCYQRRLKGENIVSYYSFRIFRKSGEYAWVQINAANILWEGRPATLNFMRDITQQKNMEEQFFQAQKMEAMGTLAGGIAHDFNNLLMAIQGNASLMLLDLDPANPYHEKLKSIENCVQRGAELTRQLLGFAQSGKYDVKPTDLNSLVMKTSEMFGRTKKEITIYRKYQQGIFAVEVDQGQMEQVLLNLLVNAWQAMPGGGVIDLETRNLIVEENQDLFPNLRRGKYVRLSITDTGMGMDAATRKRIFDPFFTTKGMGRGSGLGLASVYGIIKQHNGYIEVESEKGKGTSFYIYLPASEKLIPKKVLAQQDIVRGHETVLFVDDEQMVLDVSKDILKSIGYKVLTASGGEEALKIYDQNKNQISLVILDMIMPGMDGGKTYSHLKRLNPQIKVLLSSGYSINEEVTAIMEKGCNGFIQKPFNVKEIAIKIREILGDPVSQGEDPE
jgi:PAS domain S-box-containing protein